MDTIDKSEYYFYTICNGSATDAVRDLILRVKDHSVRELLIKTLGDLLQESNVIRTVELLNITYDQLKEMEGQSWISKQDVKAALSKFKSLLQKK